MAISIRVWNLFYRNLHLVLANFRFLTSTDTLPTYFSPNKPASCESQHFFMCKNDSKEGQELTSTETCSWMLCLKVFQHHVSASFSCLKIASDSQEYISSWQTWHISKLCQDTRKIHVEVENTPQIIWFRKLFIRRSWLKTVVIGLTAKDKENPKKKHCSKWEKLNLVHKQTCKLATKLTLAWDRDYKIPVSYTGGLLVGFSQIWMWIVLEAIIDTTTTQDCCCLPHLKS
jgi:hypothetical protein